MENKKIKLAVIGGGINSSIGPAHFAALNSSNKWIFKCGVFGKNINKPFSSIDSTSLKIYSSVKELIKFEKKNIDCFLILTPPNENFKIINLIKKTKIPIISEKPVFNSLKNLNILKNYIKKNNIKFLTTYNYSYYPALQELKHLIKNEKSKLNKIIIEMPQQGFFLKNSKIKNWRKKDKFIPNLFLDLGSHIYNLCYFITNSYPSKIFCTTNKKNNIIVDTNILCKFENGSNGVFWVSKNAGGHENDLKIELLFKNKSYLWKHTTPDEILISYNNGAKTKINRSNKNLKYLNNQEFNLYKPGHPTGYVETFINLYNFIYKKVISKRNTIKETDFNFEHSYKIIKLLNCMKISFRNNKWVDSNVE
jgi:predicted dehydrogenase